MSSHCTPLEVCELLLGGIEQVSTISGLHPKSAFPWRRASKWRAAGDLPTAKIMRRLLDHSERHGLGLTAEHLLRGASVAELENILAAQARRVEAAE